MTQPNSTSSPESRAAKIIGEIFASARPLLYVRSSEEERVGRILREVGRSFPDSPLPVWTWSMTQGLRRDNRDIESGTESARAVLDFIARYDGPAIFHLKDLHEPMREAPDIRRRVRDLYEACLDRQKFVVVSSPVRFIPEEVERDFAYIELKLPDRLEFVEFLRDEASLLAARGTQVQINPATLDQLAGTLQGLTLNEARHAIRRAVAATNSLGSESLPSLLAEKRLLVNRSGIVELIAEGTDINEVGGLETLKEWLVERRKLFHLRDSLSADITPKGVLVMGIPGCGKSLSVKAIASHFELPLYRIDMSEIFSGQHGEAESVFVQACRMLEDIAPGVVWFDEIETGITSAGSGSEHGRIFSFFLTWMQEKTRGLFVAATANRIDLLPAEMIRKGRFDEVFFVDLPHEDERRAIFKIHLNRRGVDETQANLERLVALTNGWSGAEIEQCVVAAVTRARLADRPATEADLVNIAVETVPLSRTMQEQINQIRGWASDRAVRASRRRIVR